MEMKEQHFSFEGIDVAYVEGGRGFPLLMIHGSGPGASTAGNWARVLGPLSDRFRVHAMDLIGFGKSGRKPAPPYFDFDLWLRQCLAMCRRIEGDRFGIIGHSISGALAFKAAAREPRVAAVLATGTMGAKFPLNEVTARTWTFPRDRAALIEAAKGLIHDHRLIDDAYLATRERILYGDPNYGAYFDSMFGGEKQRFIDATAVAPEDLAAIKARVTMMHGREDRGFPADATSLVMARSMPQADIVLLGQCSHSIAMEYPAKLIEAAVSLFA